MYNEKLLDTARALMLFYLWKQVVAIMAKQSALLQPVWSSSVC